MEARLQWPHSLSPRPMRRTHKTGTEEPRRERSQAKERPGPFSLGEGASATVAGVGLPSARRPDRASEP
jgi:hypothetical protein